MTFSGGGSFDGGGVRRRRGGAVAGGGIGLGAIAAFLIYQFTGFDLSPVLNGASPGGGTGQVTEAEDCTAEEANTDRFCRLVATTFLLHDYWENELGPDFVRPEVEAFEGATTTGCGNATASTGPFYCPADQDIYMDLGFFDLLESRFGASGGPLAEMYVHAHEYGHHIQNITGVMERADRSQTGADSDQVRIELQADCYAGMWVGDATETINPETNEPYLQPITEQQLADALSAAAAVGDDHIQEQSGGSVNPHTWTHGSSEQRQKWFTVGYEQGSLQACDTFATNDL